MSATATATAPRTTDPGHRADRHPQDRSPSPRQEEGGVALHRVVRSEWTKLRSLRSTWATLGLAALVALGLAAAIGSNLSSGEPDGGFGADPTAAVLAGTGLAALVLGVLGALQVSGEYATGTITASLTAVPARWPVLSAKAVVLVAVVAPLALALSAGSLWIGSLVVDGGLPFSWGAVLGSTGYLTAVALLGLGTAALLRRSAAAITVLVALVFVLPPLLPLLPWGFVETATNYFPSAAGESLSATVAGTAALSDAAAAGTLAAWALVPLLVGGVLLQRRDA